MVEDHRIEYSAVVSWTGGALGSTASYETYSRDHCAFVPGKPVLELSVAPCFHGDRSKLETEELLLFAISGCHMMTYLAIASRSGLEVLDYLDNPSATLLLEGNGGRVISAILRPHVRISASGSLELAETLHQTAAKDCFVGSSMNFPITIDAHQSHGTGPGAT